MKLTETLGFLLRAAFTSIEKTSYLIGRGLNVFLRGALSTVIFSVVFWIVTADPDAATFGDFLRGIQSPALGAIAAVGGLTFLMFGIIRS